MSAEPGTLCLHSRAPAETRAAGECLGRVLRRARAAGAVVALVGPLGAGKTCFVQGLARGLEASGYVRSPTFVLVHEHRGTVPLSHVDLYRLTPGDLDALGLDEIVEGPGVTAIEWADHAGPALPAQHLRVEVTFGPGDDDRVLRVGAMGDRYLGIVEAFSACVSSR